MATSAKLLIAAIDDDPLILDLIELFLTDFQVETARGGVEGRLMLERIRPAVIILDVAMPGIDGLALLRWLRRRETLAPVPVMMLTAKADRPTISEASRLGADGYMIKPFTGDNLQRRIRQMSRIVRLPA